MEDDNDAEHRLLLGWILGIAVTLSIAIALLSGAAALTASAPAPAAVAIAPPAAAAVVAPATATAAGGVVAKLYFDSGATALPGDATAALQPVLDAARARADAPVSISGFHDKSGDPERNAELAKQRAFAVRDALVAAGVAEARITMRKPAETDGGTDDREARRVEVSVE